LAEAMPAEVDLMGWKRAEFSPSSSAPPVPQLALPKLMSVPLSVTGEVGAGGPKVLGWRIDRYWVLDDGFRDTRGDGGQVAREDVLLPETESDRIQKVA
jgi:hypothetical protein